MTKFEEYVDKVETLINEYSSAGSGKIWLEDFVDKQINKK